MAKKLVITLDEQTTAAYLALAQKVTEAEVNADCEPSGVSLQVDIGSAHYGSSVSLFSQEIGEADVKLVDA